MENITVTEYNTLNYLDSEEMLAEYLTACLEDEDPNLFLMALSNVAKVRGMTQLSKDTGLSRESLYKTLSPGTKPRFETVLKIARALGVPLSVACE